MVRTNYKSLSAKIEEARIRTHAWALGVEGVEFPIGFDSINGFRGIDHENVMRKRGVEIIIKRKRARN